MAEGLPVRLCLHEFPLTNEASHIDLFVRAAWRISELDTFEISSEFSSDFLAELEGTLRHAASAADIAGPTAAPPPVRLRILGEVARGERGSLDSGVSAGNSSGLRTWRAERKANHRLRYWSHSGAIEPASPGGPDRGRIREVARGFLIGSLPSGPEMGFEFQFEAG